MAHDVFISHSARDKPYADGVCAKLESRGIRCWIAPRDIRPGMSWGTAIVEAIDAARVMLLLFSSHANGSPQVSREVERAVSKGLVVVPVRVENVKPSGDLEYFLGTPHWLDAITPPFERHLEGIADSAKFWLERIESDRVASETPRPSPPARDEFSAATPPEIIARARPRPKRIAPSIAALAIALVGTAAFFGARYYVAQQDLLRKRVAEQTAAAERASAAAQQREENAAQAQKERALAEDTARKRAVAEQAQAAQKAAQTEKERKRKAAEAVAQAKSEAAAVPKSLATIAPAAPERLATIEPPAPARESASVSHFPRIAISPLKNGGGDEDGRVSENFVEVVRRSLLNLGSFDLIDAQSYHQDAQQSGYELGAFDFSPWSSIAADFLVKGMVSVNGSTVDLTVYLYDVAQRRRLSGKIFKGTTGDVQAMADRFASKMVESIGTGGSNDLARAHTAPQLIAFGDAAQRLGDHTTALKWFGEAAAQGDAQAEANLGYMYEKGQVGTGPDFDQAATWYRKAAAQGNAEAENNLGYMYEAGQVGGGPDYAEAANWYRQAAAQGLAAAQNRLATMYCQGQGVSQDYSAAIPLYQGAAAQGNASAEYNLGKLYESGWGVPIDRTEALKWYELAAAQGHQMAKLSLDRLRAQ